MILVVKITIVLRKLLTVNDLCSFHGTIFFLMSFFTCLQLPAVYAQCPIVESFMVDACGKERQDEFLVINSGKNGFGLSQLQLDFDANNNNFGSLNNDIHINHGNNPTTPAPCTLVAGNVSLLGGCTSVIAVGDGDYIPPNSILIVQLGNTASHVYDFNALCGLGECIYVTKNSCDRTSGVFSNSGVGDRTLVVSLSDGSGCTQTCTYDRALLADSDGAYFAPALAGNMQYGNGGCGVTPVVDEPMPPVAFAGNDTSICVKEPMVVYLNGDISGSAISAMWSGGLGDFNDVELLQAEYYPTDAEMSLGNVSLTLTTNELGSNGSCPSGKSTIKIAFDSLPIDIQLVDDYNGYGLACDGDSNGMIQAFVFGVPPYDFDWNQGVNKNINSNLVAGEYRVSVEDALGCLGEAATTLAAPPRVEVMLDAFPEGCNGELGQIRVEQIEGGLPPFHLFLDGAFQATYQNGALNFVKKLAAGTHYLEVEDGNQCTDGVDFDINAGYDFEVDLGPDVLIPQGEEVTVTLNYEQSSTLDSIIWRIDTILGCSHCTSITRAPLFSERVNIEVTDSKGCIARDEMQIFVQQTGLYIPNVFSPNGDGINDYLTIFPSDQVAKIDYFALYDRSGNEILHLKDEEARPTMDIWDGYFKGKLMVSQALIYSIRASFKDHRTEEFYGSITLLR